MLGLFAAGEALAAAGWVDFAAGGATLMPTTGSAAFNGAFYGPGAKFAGYSYLLDTGTSGGKINGAAAFGR